MDAFDGLESLYSASSGFVSLSVLEMGDEGI